MVEIKNEKTVGLGTVGEPGCGVVGQKNKSVEKVIDCGNGSLGQKSTTD